MFPSVPPPPPPMPAAPGSENEAMYSMLISWYMSGYHTGYYQVKDKLLISVKTLSRLCTVFSL